MYAACLTETMPAFTVERQVTHSGKNAQTPAARLEMNSSSSSQPTLSLMPWISGEDSIGATFGLEPILETSDGLPGNDRKKRSNRAPDSER